MNFHRSPTTQGPFSKGGDPFHWGGLQCHLAGEITNILENIVFENTAPPYCGVFPAYNILLEGEKR